MNESPLSSESADMEIARIIQSNRSIRKLIQEQTKQFLISKNDLIKHLHHQQITDNPVVQNSETLFDTNQIESLNAQVISSTIHVALVGANSCGKTSFLHYLLRSGNFLPTGVGPVSARIIRLTYAHPEDAELRIYQSLNDKRIHQQVSLRDIFVHRQEPDWDEMKILIKDYVTRPDSDEIKSDSMAFAEWARFFVEIRIPSSFLKLDIDVYDTPGLLFSDAPVLKENLCQLVQLIQPTLVFMYWNPSITSDTQDCFLALKDALGQSVTTNMFFLNTKADLDRILDDADQDKQGIEDEKIPEIIFNERQKRYQLLLNVPSLANEFPGGLPKSLVECSCFDLVSVHFDHDEFGGQLNRTTTHRLIQFAANSDLKVARKVGQLVLPMIDVFFDLAFSTHHRTIEQFQLLRSEAMQWTEDYYHRYRHVIEKLLNQLYSNILEQLSETIAERAARFQSSILIEKYIKTAIQQEIIKVEIEKMRKIYIDGIEFNQLIDRCLLQIAQKNEFLIAAQRDSNWLFESQIIFDNKLTIEMFVKQTILAQILLIKDVFIESEEIRKGSMSLSNYQQLFSRKTSLGEDFNALEFANERLAEVFSWLRYQKTYMNEIIDAGYYIEKRDFIKKINQFHDLAIRSLSQREQLYHLVKKYPNDFASIQCKIIAALNLTQVNGQYPIIDESRKLDEHVYVVQWIGERLFLVKKTFDYLEVHHHLRIRQLGIPNMLPLLYLIEDQQTDQIWMFFPYYIRKLRDASLTIDHLFEISFDLAKCLEHLHLNEISHGSIQVESIFLDESNQCYLTNFHFHPQNQFEPSQDIDAFGQVGRFLCEHMTRNKVDLSADDVKNIMDLQILLTKCLSTDVKLRPTATVIVQRLKEIRKNL